jgi:trimethylamine:corrinoid methyltransferase-like protein
MQTILDRIHRSSLELLASIGVRFHCPETLERLAMMGVRVAGGLVRFSEAQVMDCLSMAPETFTLKSRNPEKDVRIGGDSKCLAPAYGASLVVTPENRRRNATLYDYLRIAKLVHRTPLLTLNGGVLVQPEDATGQLSSLVNLQRHVPNRGIGAVADAGQVSVQSGYEAMFTLINDYKRRTSLSIHAAGVLASFSAFSYEQFIIDLQDEATKLTENVADALVKLENQYRCPCLPEEILKRIDAYMISQGVPEHVIATVARASHAM